MSSEDCNSSISSLDYQTGSSSSSIANQKKGQNQLSAQQLQANLLSKTSLSAASGIATPNNRRKSSITYSHLQNAALSTVIAATGTTVTNSNNNNNCSGHLLSATVNIKDHHHDDKSTGKSGKCGGGGVGYDCMPSPSRFSIGASSQTQQQQDSTGALIGFHLANRSLSIHPDRYDDGITSCCLPPPSPAPSSDRFIMGIPSPVSSSSSSSQLQQQQQQQQQHYHDLKFSVHHRSMSPSSR